MFEQKRWKAIFHEPLPSMHVSSLLDCNVYLSVHCPKNRLRIVLLLSLFLQNQTLSWVYQWQKDRTWLYEKHQDEWWRFCRFLAGSTQCQRLFLLLLGQMSQKWILILNSSLHSLKSAKAFKLLIIHSPRHEWVTYNSEVFVSLLCTQLWPTANLSILGT